MQELKFQSALLTEINAKLALLTPEEGEPWLRPDGTPADITDVVQGITPTETPVLKALKKKKGR